jgi:hypothetical protein
LNATGKLAYPDIKVGIPALLLSSELFIISILHIFAFPWHPYRKSNPNNGPSRGGFFGIKAFIDALNVWDLIKAAASAVKWLFVVAVIAIGMCRTKLEPIFRIQQSSCQKASAIDGRAGTPRV